MTTDNLTETTNCSGTQHGRRTRRNSRVFALWMFIFSASFVIGGWIFKHADWAPEGPVAWVISLLPLIPGVIAFRAYLKYFREADELMRKIMIEGLLFGFGAVMVFWGAIQLPEHVWLPKIHANLVISVMMLAWSFGTIRATRRYR